MLQNLLFIKLAFGFSFIIKELATTVKNEATSPFLKFYSELAFDLNPQISKPPTIIRGIVSLIFIILNIKINNFNIFDLTAIKINT